MAVKVYEYKNCSTCQKALKFLEARNISFEKLPIVDQPPTKSELKKMLAFLKEDGGGLKHLFNTSGQVYREMKLGDRLKTMSESEAIDLLASNGKLVKRPFVLSSDFGTVGFKEDSWKQLFPKQR